MARQRNVYPTDEIAHLWAHHTQPSARNQRGNLYFEDTIIYSYRNSYPIGNIVTHGNGKHARTCVLIQENHYGVTTAKHINLVHRATSHMTTFDVPYIVPSWSTVDIDHVANLKWFSEQASDAITKASKARQYAPHTARTAASIIDNAQRYAKFFSIRKGVPKLPKDWTAFIADCKRRADRANNIDMDDPKRVAARERREALRDAKRELWRNEQATKHADAIVQWRTGELRSMPYMDNPPTGLFPRRMRWSMRQPSLPTMLRIRGNEVETSMGASFPVAHALRGLNLVRAVMARGEDWQANGHTCKLGLYQVSRITKDGTVTAGCHVVTWPEIERIANDIELVASQTHEIAQTMGE